MKKLSKKLLSILLAASMILTMLPAAAMADTIADFSIDEPEIFTLGVSDADYHLYIINDADVPMRYEITLNSEKQTTAIKANSYLSIGIKEGDKYSVKKLGNDNYKITEESATFASLNKDSKEYSQDISDYAYAVNGAFSHTFGNGLKIDENISYTLQDEAKTPYRGEVEIAVLDDIKDQYVIKGSVVSCNASVTNEKKHQGHC